MLPASGVKTVFNWKTALADFSSGSHTVLTCGDGKRSTLPVYRPYLEGHGRLTESPFEVSNNQRLSATALLRCCGLRQRLPIGFKKLGDADGLASGKFLDGIGDCAEFALCDGGVERSIDFGDGARQPCIHHILDQRFEFQRNVGDFFAADLAGECRQLGLRERLRSGDVERAPPFKGRGEGSGGSAGAVLTSDVRRFAVSGSIVQPA